MNTEEIRSLYWRQYIMLEKEFIETIPYASVEESNFNVFSDKYLKLMLAIGSETDTVLKEYCFYLNNSFCGNSIGKYRTEIQTRSVEFINQKIAIINRNIEFTPWMMWLEADDTNPDWWTVYNKTKHCRNQTGEIAGVTKPYYQFANQKYTLEALAGLFNVLIYFYMTAGKDEGIRDISPMPFSRLFEMREGIWKHVVFKPGLPVLYTAKGEYIIDRNPVF